MPATTTSQATTTLTATAAIIGDVTAITPSTINKTPHKSDQVEACRTTSDVVCCAIKGLLKGRRESSAEDMKIPEGRARWVVVLLDPTTGGLVVTQFTKLTRASSRSPRAFTSGVRDLAWAAHADHTHDFFLLGFALRVLAYS